MTQLARTIGIRLKNAREEAGMTHQEVADRIGLTALADLAPYADRLADMTDEELRPIYVALIRQLRFFPPARPRHHLVVIPLL